MKQNNPIIALAMILIIITSATVPLLTMHSAIAADITDQPSSFMEFSTAYGSAVVNIPSIGNFTRMTVVPIKEDKSSTIDSYNVMAIILSSSLTPATVQASITTNNDREDTNWRKALRNGTSQYTEVNSQVTINNLLQVSDSELKIQRNGSKLTVDFNPATPAIITLPMQFPRGSFAPIWSLPAFHMEFIAGTTGTFGNSTSSNPSGWSEYNEYVSYPSNYTFTCPSWGNYGTSGSGSVRWFNVHRGTAPGGIIIPSDTLKTTHLFNYGQATFNISSGGITQMQVKALHTIQATMSKPDIIQVNITAPGFGWLQASISTEQYSDAKKWVQRWVNGTNTYTEIDGNVTINNIFNVSPDELKVKLDGSRLTVDFNPSTPVSFTLPPAIFPKSNFAATWSVPAFSIVLDVSTPPGWPQLLIQSSASSYPSGWKQNDTFALIFANATLTVPAWNLQTTVTSGPTPTYIMPYMFTTVRSSTAANDWTLTTTRNLTAYPELQETVWQKNPNMAPHTSFDKIALHRLVKNGTTPKGVVFVNPGTYGSFEGWVSSISTENNSQPIYWAKQGYDVYGIDYRTHFVNRNINDTKQLSVMADWGWDQWLSDMKEAVEKTKEVSCAAKVFMAGQSFGGGAAMFYASKYQQDLKGIILLDGGSTSKRVTSTNTYNLAATIDTMKTYGNWSFEMPNLSSGAIAGIPPGMMYLYQFAYAFPNAPANVPGTNTPLPPAINPLTNKTFANITEWMAFNAYSTGMSNTLLGYSNSSQGAYTFGFLMDRYWPVRLGLEQAAAFDWTNCQQVTFDFDDNFKNINVPLLSFNSELFGLKVRGNIVNGMATTDFTSKLLPNYGHGDVFSGLYSARDVSQPTLIWMNDHIPSDWTQTTTQTLKAYPNLQETIWQKSPATAPNGPYDKIALHRLVKTGTTPKGVIYFTGCPMWGMGEQRITNPPTDNWTKTESYSGPIYWANQGYDVYAIDYRPNFVPKTLNLSQTATIAANWGWDVWIADTKEGAEKVKEVSGSKKFFIAGECSGGFGALNYAAKYWQEDLRGIILLDANFVGVSGYPLVAGSTAKATNTYNLPAAIAGMIASGTGALDNFRSARPIMAYAMQNPGAPAQYPPGTPLSPAINPVTNKTWANITEWVIYGVQYNFGSTIIPPGSMSNLFGGQGNLSQVENCFATGTFLPLRLVIENLAMADWVNCPYLTYDYNDYYGKIGVPLLAYAGPYTNQTGTLRFMNGIDNSDFTATYMPNYGHLDFFLGTNSAKDINQPIVNWIANHYQPPAASTFSSTTVFAGQTWYFCVHSNGGQGPYKYQWYEGTTQITGQTNMILAANKSATGTYTYYCKVTDAEGATANSSPVTLTVK